MNKLGFLGGQQIHDVVGFSKEGINTIKAKK